jgi:hypothetical protein
MITIAAVLLLWVIYDLKICFSTKLSFLSFWIAALAVFVLPNLSYHLLSTNFQLQGSVSKIGSGTYHKPYQFICGRLPPMAQASLGVQRWWSSCGECCLSKPSSVFLKVAKLRCWVLGSRTINHRSGRSVGICWWFNLKLGLVLYCSFARNGRCRSWRGRVANFWLQGWKMLLPRTYASM